MSLYDVTFKKDVLIKPDVASTSRHIQVVLKSYPAVTFKKILRILDEAIDSVKPSKSSRLVWTKTGALFGRNTERPLRDVDYVWEKVIGAVGNDKNCLITMGSLFRWRISLRPETWLVYRQDSENIDPTTGRAILISTYWIDETYIFRGEVKKSKAELKAPAHDFATLAQKFNSVRC